MKNEKDVVTGLTTKGTSDFGKALIAEAQESNRDSMKKSLIGHAGTILMQIRKQTDYRDNVDQNIKLLKSKVAALEAGEFTVGPYGQLKFNDEALEKAIIVMVECTNCGFPMRNRG